MVGTPLGKQSFVGRKASVAIIFLNFPIMVTKLFCLRGEAVFFGSESAGYLM